MERKLDYSINPKNILRVGLTALVALYTTGCEAQPISNTVNIDPGKQKISFTDKEKTASFDFNSYPFIFHKGNSTPQEKLLIESIMNGQFIAFGCGEVRKTTINDNTTAIEVDNPDCLNRLR